jgi:hypothetical protein
MSNGVLPPRQEGPKSLVLDLDLRARLATRPGVSHIPPLAIIESGQFSSGNFLTVGL